MSDSSRYEASLTPTIYFFVDKQSDEVAAIHMYSIFGIFVMEQSIQDWRPASRLSMRSRSLGVGMQLRAG